MGKRADRLRGEDERAEIGGEKTMFYRRVQKIGHKGRREREGERGRSGTEEMEAGRRKHRH